MRCLDDVRLSLNKLPIWASTFVDHYDTRSGQGENVNGPHAPLITLAHELGHALLNLGEYGAVTFWLFIKDWGHEAEEPTCPL